MISAGDLRGNIVQPIYKKTSIDNESSRRYCSRMEGATASIRPMGRPGIPGRKLLTIKVSAYEAEVLKRYAAENETTLTDVIRRYIRSLNQELKNPVKSS
jgi:hypothetical protein